MKKAKKEVYEDLVAFVYCLQLQSSYDDMEHVRAQARYHVQRLRECGKAPLLRVHNPDGSLRDYPDTTAPIYESWGSISVKD